MEQHTLPLILGSVDQDESSQLSENSGGKYLVFAGLFVRSWKLSPPCSAVFAFQVLLERVRSCSATECPDGLIQTEQLKSITNINEIFK